MMTLQILRKAAPAASAARRTPDCLAESSENPDYRLLDSHPLLQKAGPPGAESMVLTNIGCIGYFQNRRSASPGMPPAAERSGRTSPSKDKDRL